MYICLSVVNVVYMYIGFHEIAFCEQTNIGVDVNLRSRLIGERSLLLLFWFQVTLTII